jgi:hypothetical protein
MTNSVDNRDLNLVPSEYEAVELPIKPRGTVLLLLGLGENILLVQNNVFHASEAKCLNMSPSSFMFIDRIKPRGSTNHFVTIRILRKTYTPTDTKLEVL